MDEDESLCIRFSGSKPVAIDDGLSPFSKLVLCHLLERRGFVRLERSERYEVMQRDGVCVSVSRHDIRLAVPKVAEQLSIASADKTYFNKENRDGTWVLESRSIIPFNRYRVDATVGAIDRLAHRAARILAQNFT